MLSSRSLRTIQDLSADDIMLVLELARRFREINERPIKKLPSLRGRTIINLFLEPSTRTRTSFEIAAKRLSADAINISGSASSTVKGESITDTAETLSAMNCDLLICRHRYAGTPHLLEQHLACPVINAGDGKHQHPTQTLLDLFTIREELGGIEGKTVGIVGDILHSRVAGSLGPALKLLGAKPLFIAAPTLLPSRPDVLGAEVCWNLDECIGDLDVVYMLRIQSERLDSAPFPSVREYSMLYGIDQRRLDMMKDDAIIMHPGPINRGVELMPEAADSPRAHILDQVNAGVAVRMALMYLILGGAIDGVAV
ncbi:MAG: aspartate carbamoyltransferase catalytic subunit [Coriobacteriales bacterium]|nr:aspartate carbamoyltransferase catalytic subunit [Coriobacteriales bacterium]